jgi:predicted enzyme related to lactoylglutathione lyase
MTLKHIEIFSVPVSDQDKAKRFYIEVLGFKLLRDDPMGPEMRWVQLGIEGAVTSISLVTWFEEMPPGSLKGIMLQTADLAATVADYRSKGVAVSDIAEEPWGRYATFRDPDGNGFVLQQPPG